MTAAGKSDERDRYQSGANRRAEPMPGAAQNTHQRDTQGYVDAKGFADGQKIHIDRMDATNRTGDAR